MHAQNHDVIIFPAVGFLWVEGIMLLLKVRHPLAVSRESDVVLLACLPNIRSLFVNSLLHSLSGCCVTYV